MVDLLLLRLQAPLMSFGGASVDATGVIRPFPAQSMMTGLIGNALGYDRSETGRLTRLQERLRFAVRRDRGGTKVRDFQTADLGQPFMRKAGWTTRHERRERAGGSAATGTHIRERDYWADALYTVALTLRPEDESPDLATVAHALRRPARPLFLGRKPCLPSRPLLEEMTEAPSLLDALRAAPPVDTGDGEVVELEAWWPDDVAEGSSDPSRSFPVRDLRDWGNAIHVGRRTLHHGVLTLDPSPDHA